MADYRLVYDIKALMHGVVEYGGTLVCALGKENVVDRKSDSRY